MLRLYLGVKCGHCQIFFIFSNRTFREEVITPEMRSFAEARLETSALLHAARSGSALKLPPPKRQLMDPMPQPSSSSEVNI